MIRRGWSQAAAGMTFFVLSASASADWTIGTIDAGGNAGYRLGMAFQPGSEIGHPGVLHVIYEKYDGNSRTVEYARRDRTLRYWTRETIGFGREPSIAWDATAGAPIIAYLQQIGGSGKYNLRYAKRVGTGGNCASGKWSCDDLPPPDEDDVGWNLPSIDSQSTAISKPNAGSVAIYLTHVWGWDLDEVWLATGSVGAWSTLELLPDQSAVSAWANGASFGEAYFNGATTKYSVRWFSFVAFSTYDEPIENSSSKVTYTRQRVGTDGKVRVAYNNRVMTRNGTWDWSGTTFTTTPTPSPAALIMQGNSPSVTWGNSEGLHLARQALGTWVTVDVDSSVGVGCVDGVLVPGSKRFIVYYDQTHQDLRSAEEP